MKGKWIAVPLLLLLWACPQVWASTFPNTYAVSKTMSYDPTIGSAGTLTINYQFTGTTSPGPMCNTPATHTPKVTTTLSVKGSNGQYTETAQQFRQGTGVAPCVQMNQTLSMSFDLGSDQCTMDDLLVGSCLLSEEQDVYCSVAAGFYVYITQSDTEVAITYSQNTHHPAPPNGVYVVDWATPESTPCDYSPNVVQSSNPQVLQSSFFNGLSVCQRRKGAPAGSAWTCINPSPIVTPEGDTTLHTCTNYDKKTVGVYP